MRTLKLCLVLFGSVAFAGAGPFASQNPQIESGEFYAFRSYETGRTGYVTLLANYQPRKPAANGPLVTTMSPEALYEIHVDSDGDAKEDLTFQFRFSVELSALTMMVGAAGQQVARPVPLAAIGAVTAMSMSSQNVRQTYTLTLVRGDRRTGASTPVTQVGTGNATFTVPLDDIGTKTIANYATYANTQIFSFDLPGCTPTGVAAGTHARVFVGQRAESLAMNRGQLFDLLNFSVSSGGPMANVIGAPDQGHNTDAALNVTTLALELPASCLNDTADSIIGAWTSASLKQVRVVNPSATPDGAERAGGPWVQVTHAGMPLVSDLIVGSSERDVFNRSTAAEVPTRLGAAFTNPILPALFELEFGGAGVVAPTNFPRTDFVAFFTQGLTGLNATATSADLVRLNTSPAPVAPASQVALGALACFTRGASGATFNASNPGCDQAGFPNGRRPGDDVVDISFRVAMGYLAPTGSASSGSLPFVDGAVLPATAFLSAFPYLSHPIPGSP